MAQIINFDETKNKKHNQKANKTENERCNNILENLEEKRKDFTTSIITRTAEDILKALDFFNIRGSIPIVRIAQAFGVMSYTEVTNDNNIKGILYINGTTKKVYGQERVIIVNEKNDLYFNRFIVARQLAVFLFNFKEKEKNKNKLFTDKYYSNQYCKDYERFATEILMPLNMFGRQYMKRVEEFYNYRSKTRDLSRYFEVPEYLVERRINELIH